MYTLDLSSATCSDTEDETEKAALNSPLSKKQEMCSFLQVLSTALCSSNSTTPHVSFFLEKSEPIHNHKKKLMKWIHKSTEGTLRLSEPEREQAGYWNALACLRWFQASIVRHAKEADTLNQVIWIYAKCSQISTMIKFTLVHLNETSPHDSAQNQPCRSKTHHTHTGCKSYPAVIQ